MRKEILAVGIVLLIAGVMCAVLPLLPFEVSILSLFHLGQHDQWLFSSVGFGLKSLVQVEMNII